MDEKMFGQVVKKRTDRFQSGRFNMSLMREQDFATAEEETLDKHWVGRKKKNNISKNFVKIQVIEQSAHALVV